MMLVLFIASTTRVSGYTILDQSLTIESGQIGGYDFSTWRSYTVITGSVTVTGGYLDIYIVNKANKDIALKGDTFQSYFRESHLGASAKFEIKLGKSGDYSIMAFDTYGGTVGVNFKIEAKGFSLLVTLAFAVLAIALIVYVIRSMRKRNSTIS